MQIVNGQPVFGSNDVVFRNDGKYAYDSKGNVMGLWDGTGAGATGNPLNTDQTSFLDFLKQSGGAGLDAGIGPGNSFAAGQLLSRQNQAQSPSQSSMSGLPQGLPNFSVLQNSQIGGPKLTGANADMWGNADNPYYSFMLQLMKSSLGKQFGGTFQEGFFK